MELTFHTDYALRVLIYLGVRGGERAQVADIARLYDVSRNHLVKVVHHLAQGGFIDSYRGRGGGIVLARDPASIRIGDVVRFTEGPVRPVECFREANECLVTEACGLPPILSEAFRNFIATLNRYTLADLVAKRAPLEQMFDRRRLARSRRRKPSGARA